MTTYSISIEMLIDAEDCARAVETFERELEEHGSSAGSMLIRVLTDEDEDEDEADEELTTEQLKAVVEDPASPFRGMVDWGEDEVQA